MSSKEQITPTPNSHFDYFSKLPGVSHETLHSASEHVTTELQIDSHIDAAVNERIGIEQELIGIVEAGDESFGIVRVIDTNQGETGLIVTHFSKEENRRASIVGVIRAEHPVLIGRDYQADLSDTTSKKHFDVRLSTEGTVIVTDQGSTNGTDILSAVSEHTQGVKPAEKTAVKGLKGLLKRRKRTLGDTTIVESSHSRHEDYRIWAAPSKDTHAALSGTISEVEGNQDFEPRFQSFKESYDLPEDQIKAEDQLIREFNAKYPEHYLLGHMLKNISEATGMQKMSDLKLIGKIGDNKDIEPADYKEAGANEEGYLEIGEVLYHSLFLTEPLYPSREEFQAMSEDEKDIVSASHKAMILGEIPQEVLDAFEAIFELTGAKKVRDDKAEGIPSGQVMWKGSYHGTEFYLTQEYGAPAGPNWWGGKSTFSSRILGARYGQHLPDEPRGEDIDKLLAIGMSRGEIRDAGFEGVIRRNNVDDIVSMANELNKNQE